MKISGRALEKYNFDLKFFNTKEGYITFPKTYLARLFVEVVNKKRDILNYPEQAARASEINAIGLMNEISHKIFSFYKQEQNSNLFKTILSQLESSIGEEKLTEVLESFVREFPPIELINSQVTEKEYLISETEGISNKEIVIEEIFHNWIQNSNPSLTDYIELFSGKDLEKKEEYQKVIEEIIRNIDSESFLGSEEQTLYSFIHNPILKAPHSLKAQLEYILINWVPFLDTSFHYRLLYALDLFNEEEKIRLLGTGPTEVYEYGVLEERYTPDKDWMTNVTLIAKNTYVWLYQLSAKYKRQITQLDQIPEEELEQLAKWGFNSLWLIGLWERSTASKTIKQWCGNPEAEASAYSLHDYVIAADLGGEKAFEKLKTKAKLKGIKLAADMVPNHTGVDSKWIREHPEWFLSSDFPPFPSYSYSGESLSKDPNIGIYIEDHYFSRTDAAVTFKHVDNTTGKVRYIYHGNDGTSMPWNDTAQLNYLLKEVREAVIQTILHVARKFPIIRFDAAMTLTRKHFQRLWFPPPGSGGDIPSRAGSGITFKEFDKLMPQEFWREVVDRINTEMPETLLLAEAFWLLEGFFVRTLGMHRVYNSAFLNMLRDEDNANYRSVIKNTMEYDPQIMKRFVNFLSNPDEESAAKGFGKGDKYFGVCLLLTTMPGLPLFSHGMIEGFAEKYGMEYRRPYWDEANDVGLIEHHEKIIFPLLKRRYMFSDVTHFYMYDFWTKEGFVDEDVFCFSNGTDSERSLIVYHNKFKNTSGWIRQSISFLEKASGKLINTSLSEGLSLKGGKSAFLIFKDQITNLEYIRNVEEIKNNGLHVILGPYQSLALINPREVKELGENQYTLLEEFLGGQGVPNIEEARQQLIFEPLYTSFHNLLNEQFVKRFIQAFIQNEKKNDFPILNVENLTEFSNKVKIYLEEDFTIDQNTSGIIEVIKNNINLLVKIKSDDDLLNQLSVEEKGIMTFIQPHSPEELYLIMYWICFQSIGNLVQEENNSFISRSLFDEWFFGKEFNRQFDNYFPQESKMNPEERIQLLRLLISNQNSFFSRDRRSMSSFLQELLKDTEIQLYLKFNRFKDILWFNSERFTQFIRLISWISLLKFSSYSGDLKLGKYLKEILLVVHLCQEALVNSEYQVEKLLSYLDFTTYKL